jgi:hypothetical protein
MSRDWQSREDDFEYKPVRQTAKGIGWTGVLVALAVVVFGVLGIAHWGFGVFASDIKGQGDAIVTKNEAGNRIRAQEGFESRWQALLAADKNITLKAEELATKPGDVKASTELSGMKMICNDLIGEWNAAARKFTQADFKAADLPQVVDETKSETDCKETVK